MKKLNSRTIWCLTASLLAMPGYAFGQSPSAQTQQGDRAPVDPGDTDATGVQDIVVTATRRLESQQLVPSVVTAFSAESLVAQGVTTVSELSRIVPGLQVQRAGAANNLYLRGVGTNTAGFNAESPVAVYLDGLYLPNAGSSPFSFNNIERIEVLKGPQGTLYGRNSTGGLVNVITRNPGREFKLDASVGYANYDTFNANLYASAPLGDDLAANIAVTHTNQADGWGRNTVDGSDLFTNKETGLQGKLRWTPGDKTTIQLQGAYVDVKTDQGNVNSVYPGSIGLDGNGFLGEYVAGDRRTPFVDSKFRAASLKIEHDLGPVSLMSLTGYIDAQALSLLNRFGIPGAFVGQGTVWSDIYGRSKTFSQELQLTSNPDDDSPFSWIAGLYYFHDNTTTRFDTLTPCAGNTAASCIRLPGNAAPSRTAARATTRSYAAYGEGTYKLTPSTRVTLGARYTRDDKGLSGLISYLQGRPNSITVGPPGLPQPVSPGLPTATLPAIPTSKTYSKPTFKVVLAQDLEEDVHAYASYNTGFRAGTYNVTSFSNPPIPPETLDAFELGIKSDLFGRVLRLNAAVFYMDYKKIQLRTSAPPAPVGSVIIYSASSAKIKGVDLDFELVPARGLSITGSMEYLDTRYGTLLSQCSVPPGAGPNGGGNRTIVPCNNSGHRMPYAPRFSYTLGFNYTFETQVGSFNFGVSDAYKSKMFWDPANRLSQKAFHLVNASTTWTSSNEKFDVQLFVRNLTGKYYLVAGSETSADLHVPGAPRTYGIKLGVHF
ncbi:TonB-dependent receptor [Rhizorhabdus dicambivorans]|nr:TonB-dependent receptor [Rhizorhabdus dicambivorans]